MGAKPSPTVHSTKGGDAIYIYSKRWLIVLLAAPVLILFTLYQAKPLLQAFITSFTQQPLFVAGGSSLYGAFCGLDNYRYIFKDDVFQHALLNTGIITAFSLLLMLPLGFFVGVLFTKKFRLNGMVKLALFMPFILSGVITALLWHFILDPGLGLINQVLRNIGLGAFAFKWIGGLYLTPYSVTIIAVWGSAGYFGLLYMAGLKMLPKETMEAAIVDGATPFQRTVFITIPMLKETNKTMVTLTFIGAMATFQSVFILTAGGPIRRSHTLATWMYETIFGNAMGGQLGWGSAIAVVMFILIFLPTTIFLGRTSKRVGD
jgi:raffinose/stachyose/melibiose transport system permease protein